MKSVKLVGTLIGTLLVLFISRVLYLTTNFWLILQASPWWVYVLIAGIIISGYLSLKFTRDEAVMEQHWIEQEGEIFMEPIRKRRQNKEMINE